MQTSAKVNLNFWITPNKFNINKNSGGLRVYDEPAPKNWPFAKYNRNTEDIMNFLKQKNRNLLIYLTGLIGQFYLILITFIRHKR